MYDHLRLTATPLMPYMDLIDHDHKLGCKGITCHVIKYLSRSLNFTYDLVTFKGPVIEVLKNGSWGGTFGYIERGVSLNAIIYESNYNHFSYC